MQPLGSHPSAGCSLQTALHEYERDRIDIAIAPGFIETDMTDSLPDAQKAALASQIPMGRLGTVDEIAKAVLFLAGDNASYITAQTIHINGGMYAS